MRHVMLLALLLAGCGGSAPGPETAGPVAPSVAARGRAVSRTVPLQTGWNALAFECQRITEVAFGTGVVGLIFYDGSAYQTRPPELASINEGNGARRGFWVFSQAAGNVSYSGEEDGRGNFLELVAGWNLVSLASDQAPLATNADPNVVLSPAYEIQADGSSQAVELTALQPGRCYWVFARSAFRLTFTGPAPSPSPSPVPTPQPSPGGPLPGLSDAQTSRFQEGRREFTTERRGTRELGPIFNGTSCVECHFSPTVGGGSPILVQRFGRSTGGSFDPLTGEGGSVLQVRALPGSPVEVIPASANVRAARRSTQLFGFGLYEAIPDAALEEVARNQPAAVAGEIHRVGGRVGRFGWKSQLASLRDFAGDALANEHGISNLAAPFENLPNQAPRAVATANLEDQPDSLGRSDVDRLADFMRFLAPLPGTPPAELFIRVGCANCHQPTYSTVSSEPELDGKTVFPYSDFLLHDIGTGDGIAQDGAPAQKMRTAPLAGIRHQTTLLHDGSARTVLDAIRAHGGQASASTAAFQALSAQERQALVDFVSRL